MPKTIKLSQTWQLGDKIGDGALGDVFEASDPEGNRYAAKRVPKEPGADRELLFGDAASHPNIIPLVDKGEWEDYLYLVMPRAEMSLHDYLAAHDGPIPWADAAGILMDIARGLEAISGKIVHRDVKPKNILLLNGHWCVADFGISRYAENSTSSETRKFWKTREYAAPEQWKGEHATSQTDMYAFGVMAYEMLMGSLPFIGPHEADFRTQHLHLTPGPVAGCPKPVAAMIANCMLKPMQSRPVASVICSILEHASEPVSPEAGLLQAANLSAVQEKAKVAAATQRGLTEQERRSALYDVARPSLEAIASELQARIVNDAPEATIQHNNGFELKLLNGLLSIDRIAKAHARCLAAHGYTCFDVIAYSAIGVKEPRTYDYEGRSHSLWYCDAETEGVYRWYELAFMVNGLIRESFTINPFALPPTDKEAAGAFIPVMNVRQLAWGPAPIDQGEHEDFMSRWIGWFAKCATGDLQHPSAMPDGPRRKFRAPTQDGR
jgi:serine/threonine-protein kinase